MSRSIIDWRNSPLTLQILLHYWTRPFDYAHNDPTHQNSPAVQSLLESFVSADLLARNTDLCEHQGARYIAGPALSTYITAICNVPFPVQVWKIPGDTK